MSAHLPNTKILVTGASGQLGLTIQEVSKSYPEYEFVFADKKVLNIVNYNDARDYITNIYPDVVINAAAYTHVDLAESNEESAYAINKTGASNLAQICKEEQIKFIHISTDYVFDGQSTLPYIETDRASPVTVYGKSKYAGEEAIHKICPEVYVIIRTSWLYSIYSHNFYKTMLRLGKEKDEISVVNDQKGTPTLANDLVKAIMDIIPMLDNSNRGVYHYSNEGETTWYAFAKAIFEISEIEVTINPVSSNAFPTVALRPKHSVLDCTKIVKIFDVKQPFWKDSLEGLFY